jgi:putative DNA-invertase from lambdoid prophage Rac
LLARAFGGVDALDVLARLKDRDVSLHMIDLGGDVTGNGISKLVFTILSAVAEAERDRTRERITEVKRDQRARGRFLGGTVPFGYRLGVDGELIPNEEEQEAIREARMMKEDGHPCGPSRRLSRPGATGSLTWR